MNDKEISLDMSWDEYIGIFNRLMNIRRIAYPIRGSPKAFNNSFMVEKSSTLISIMSFLKLKGCNKLSRLASLGFKHNDFRANSFEEEEFDAES